MQPQQLKSKGCFKTQRSFVGIHHKQHEFEKIKCGDPKLFLIQKAAWENKMYGV